MLIEFMGPSGVGKTSVINRYALVHGSRDQLQLPQAIDYRATRLLQSWGSDRTAGAINQSLPPAFLDGCMDIVIDAYDTPAEKLNAIQMLHDTAKRWIVLETLRDKSCCLHDELFLHRAFAFLLPHRDWLRHAEWYFNTVPTPDLAIIVTAPPETILGRHKDRGKSVNTYRGRSDDGILELIHRSLGVHGMAASILAERGVRVAHLDATGRLDDAVNALDVTLAPSIRTPAARPEEPL
jgi:hypothetical protein